MWLIFAILSAVTAALMTLVGKIGLKGVDPTLATGIRSFFMFVLMVGIVLAGNKLKGITHLDQKALVAILVSAVFGALSWLFYFMALRDGTATHVAAVDRLSLIFVVALSAAVLSEKLTWLHGVGSLLATAGIILIALA